MKNEMIRLIERIQRTHKWKCICSNECGWHEVATPAYIGDVLEKINQMRGDKTWQESMNKEAWAMEQLPYKWMPCGLTKSLQQIFSEAEWECQICDNIKSCPNPESLKPKQPHIRELFQFLLQLGL